MKSLERIIFNDERPCHEFHADDPLLRELFFWKNSPETGLFPSDAMCPRPSQVISARDRKRLLQGSSDLEKK
ncbi:hypothetical protein BpHYR1_051642 [Brachionus plicatilis]|uniref:Uncharacterized protein n=1 Tax=Brachionus plicatilis TaxID=10195 RepID=A0A3M7S0D5_BRAPC|nr:hypothetical protein BpHYR1_051642 [Brachionus plicatilis]